MDDSENEEQKEDEEKPEEKSPQKKSPKEKKADNKKGIFNIYFFIHNNLFKKLFSQTIER